MRLNDKIHNVKAQTQATARKQRTAIGCLLVVGGCALAIIRPEHAILGVGVALAGAGAVEPTLLLNLLKR